MSNAPYLTGLATALREEGITNVTEEPGWKDRTLFAEGFRELQGVVYHITEAYDSEFRGKGNMPSKFLTTNGFPEDGEFHYPRYNILIGRDGEVRLIAAGSAAHAGTGSWDGIPKDQGNLYMIGVSADANSQGYPITAAQINQMALVGAALNRIFEGWRGLHLMHGEWAPGRRTDPTNIPGGWDGLRKMIASGKGYTVTPNKVSAPSTATTHTVAKGETLWSISLKYGIELADLTTANPKVSANNLGISDKLVIPVKIHTVVKGDNLTKIAEKYGTTVDTLAKLNNLSNPNDIQLGQAIRTV